MSYLPPLHDMGLVGLPNPRPSIQDILAQIAARYAGAGHGPVDAGDNPGLMPGQIVNPAPPVGGHQFSPGLSLAPEQQAALAAAIRASQENVGLSPLASGVQRQQGQMRVLPFNPGVGGGQLHERIGNILPHLVNILAPQRQQQRIPVRRGIAPPRPMPFKSHKAALYPQRHSHPGGAVIS